MISLLNIERKTNLMIDYSPSTTHVKTRITFTLTSIFLKALYVSSNRLEAALYVPKVIMMLRVSKFEMELKHGVGVPF